MKISKNPAKKPVRLTKEQREAKKAKIAERKAKLAEKRAQKKAARLAKLEAKKQKAAEKRAAAKAKREAKKAKELAKRQLMRDRKAQKKLDAKIKKDPVNKLAKRVKIKRNIVEKVSSNEVVEKPHNAKLEAERVEFKTLSGIRRYIKDHLKELLGLDDVKRDRKVKKLSKMGYDVVVQNGVVCSVSYSFTASNTKAKKILSEQPKDFVDTKIVESTNKEAEVKEEKKDETPMDDDMIEGMEDFDEVLDRFDDSKAEKAIALEKLEDEEILVGDAFKDESEVAAEAEENSNVDSTSDDELDEEEDEDDLKSSDDEFIGHDDISDDQADYRREAFNNAEMDGMYD